jgi:phospholipid/cholesterol/gamma-HCH transport system permease protein
LYYNLTIVKEHSANSTESNIIELLGSTVLYFFTALKYIFTFRVNFKQLINNLVFIGYESLAMILILSAIATMILTLNTSIELNNQGGRELVGALIAIANLREIIPIFIAFAISARCGTAFTAEISTMKVTEQIDVLRVLRIDPVYYLLAPVLLAVFLLSPFLLSITSIFSIMAGMLVAKFAISLEYAEFLDSAWATLSLKEYYYPLIKTLIFSIYALTVNISMGLNCKGGAREVGMTTTRATALVIVGIIVIDGILTPILY